jgi:hypothetical protein
MGRRGRRGGFLVEGEWMADGRLLVGDFAFQRLGERWRVVVAWGWATVCESLLA